MSEFSTARSSTERGMPFAQYDVLMYWCTASRSSRARSVEIRNSPRTHSRGSSRINSTTGSARGGVANAMHLGRANAALGEKLRGESLRLGDSLHLDRNRIERLLHLGE